MLNLIMLMILLLLSKKLFFHSFAINVWSIFLSCVLVQLLCTANISHIAHGSLRFSNHYLYKQIMVVSLNNLIYEPNCFPLTLTMLFISEYLPLHPHIAVHDGRSASSSSLFRIKSFSFVAFESAHHCAQLHYIYKFTDSPEKIFQCSLFKIQKNYIFFSECVHIDQIVNFSIKVMNDK